MRDVVATIDLAETSIRDLNAQLHAVPAHANDTDFTVLNPNGAHAVAAGLTQALHVSIEGHVGYYCAGMNQEAVVEIRGNAGTGVAENIMSGEVRVRGNASQSAGASGHGGLLVIGGDASARCGISMKGVDIVVGGSVGHMSAFMAQAGHLVVCGDAGHDLGDSIYEAVIYVAGKVESLGADCVEKDMTDAHKATLAGLLERAGIGADVGGFRRYGSARNLYNFKIDNAGQY
jgi:glutamate synthase domain-containing protein 3